MPDRPNPGALLFTDLDNRVRLSRALVMTGFFLVVPWLIYFSVKQDWDSFRDALFTALPSIPSLILFQLGYHYAARLLWLIIVPLTLLGLTIYFGAEVDPELTFLAFIGIPFLFFSWETEPRTLWALVAYVTVLAIVALSFDQFGNRDWLPPPPAMEEQEKKMIIWGTRINVTLLILAELTYLAFLLQRSSKQAQQALRDANAATRAKGEFLANMSHEIRTPMNGLIGMVEVLETMDLDERQNRAVGTIRNSAFSLLRIIDDILDASKIEAGKLSVEASKVELRPLIESTCQMLQAMSDNHEVQMRFYLSPELPDWVMTDSGRLRQILLNLLSNAIKYSASRLTHRKSTVLLEFLPSSDGGLRFTITDNGIGMSPEVQKKLFQPFMQAEQSSHRQVSGTGLGLVITNSLVRLMKGTISVQSREGEGTVVTVDLPLRSVDGPKSYSDISGISVACIGLIGDKRVGQKTVYLLQKLLRTAGAKASVFSNADDFISSDITPRPDIVLLSAIEHDNADQVQTLLEEKFPGTKFIRFCSNRSERYGLIAPNVYRIQVFPMMHSELFFALSMFAGRESPTHAARKVVVKEEHALPNRYAHVLVVEDNDINQEVLGKQLEILGYSYELASDGAAGLALWRTQSFDLVLTDCHMPVMDGFELTAAIRNIECEKNLPPTPIVAITANAMEGEVENCLSAGMDSYLAKPVELAALRRTIAELLG